MLRADPDGMPRADRRLEVIHRNRNDRRPQAGEFGRPGQPLSQRIGNAFVRCGVGGGRYHEDIQIAVTTIIEPRDAAKQPKRAQTKVAPGLGHRVQDTIPIGGFRPEKHFEHANQRLKVCGLIQPCSAASRNVHHAPGPADGSAP